MRHARLAQPELVLCTIHDLCRDPSVLTLDLQRYIPMCLHMYDGSHRFHAAKEVAAGGMDLPICLAVFPLPDGVSDDVIREEMQALNKRVAVPDQLLDQDASPQLT